MSAPVPALDRQPSGPVVMSGSEWRDRLRWHQERLDPFLQPHIERASRHEKHPVMDFLFQYYPFAPAHLRRWTPGIGVILSGEEIPGWNALKEARRCGEGWIIDEHLFPERRHHAVAWVLNLLESTESRPPRFGCFGLHEWAMVYRTTEVRHGQLPLRFTPEETARIVESLPVNCSHYDAFRFFTPEARPLNRLQPSLAKRSEMEQRGCLHVNMDLYKWASQFYPWISSDVIADAFLLACRIRELDMRASPYDLAALGMEPVLIETEAGRKAYVEQQQLFAEAAVPIRRSLIGEFRRLQAALTER